MGFAPPNFVENIHFKVVNSKVFITLKLRVVVG